MATMIGEKAKVAGFTWPTNSSMVQPFFTIRFLMLVTACVAVALWKIAPITDAVIVDSPSPLDVAINGAGFFQVVDDETLEICFTRAGKLEIDEDGELSISVDRRLWKINPPIQFPDGTQKVTISGDGFVRALRSDGWSTVGRFQLFRFRDMSPFPNAWSMNPGGTVSGDATAYDPSVESGELIQGKIERAPPNVAAIAKSILLAVVASLVIRLLFVMVFWPYRLLFSVTI